ncbi:MAG: MetQ/NlpA family ABC transporter substrate-binding protein [Actinomyces urogenitalis]|jgi:D-methionine transport system substrate-binding protein|uniref:Lipoprotein n=5 Tax=root TaxID=1 RepID=C0W4Z8_9ACTO|nr:MetQ/NlpA family ABC transporter substrate-binding protein [Actinomyces urogenitalis]EEH66205.1 NLPA lipoprotein [Actinomyces urogenitalis DSM 15434]MDK8835396.1 MetQ/NlpA family ABC transporter substrate-binding protein [Actinomyces urogenitalis]MDU0972237.1 MetQ/NlpA family ABC transporter substrate-binding protein [Actinomyces urogenitalis]MDU6152265.1 MetQ/NlpA family ABC transporter substrate-binding protein [Actinomyces urogenitalis]MDU7428755.1 MetQ/NlpA family ABC transporter substr
MSLTISRRSAVAGGLATALAATLAACGKSSDSASSSSTASAASGSSDGEVDGITVDGDVTTISVGATPNPHVEMLQWIQDNLAADAGLKLDIVEITDYQTPNSSLDDGSLAANFYQTPNFLKQQEEEKGYDFEAIADVHIEPMGLYSSKYKSVDEIPDGGTIVLNNDPANTARGLKLLEQAGLIKLDESVEMPSDLDVTENSKNLTFTTVDGAQVARTMEDADAAVINGNYALEAGLKPNEDALVLEKAEGSPYANQLVVRAADKDNESLKKLAELMNADAFRTWIEENWTDGSVLPAF